MLANPSSQHPPYAHPAQASTRCTSQPHHSRCSSLSLSHAVDGQHLVSSHALGPHSGNGLSIITQGSEITLALHLGSGSHEVVGVVQAKEVLVPAGRVRDARQQQGACQHSVSGRSRRWTAYACAAGRWDLLVQPQGCWRCGRTVHKAYGCRTMHKASGRALHKGSDTAPGGRPERCLPAGLDWWPHSCAIWYMSAQQQLSVRAAPRRLTLQRRWVTSCGRTACRLCWQCPPQWLCRPGPTAGPARWCLVCQCQSAAGCHRCP